MTLTRRQLLQQLGATAGAAIVPLGVIRGRRLHLVEGTPVEIAVFSVSPDTVAHGAAIEAATLGAFRTTARLLG